MDTIPSSTVIIEVGVKTPGGREGFYVRFADGIMANISGTHSEWIKAFPVVQWNQHGHRFDAIAEYSADKIAATKKMAAGD